MSTLTDFKRAMSPGTLVDVTNHYVTREDHPSFGTTRRVITKTNSASYYTDASPWPLAWPKASEIGRCGEVWNIDYPGKPGVQFLSIKVVAE